MYVLLLCMLLGVPAEELVGAWDKKVEAGAPVETLYLFEDGRLIIDGVMTHYGSYKVEGDTLTTTLTVAGEKKDHPRKFKLEGDALELTIDDGFSRYTRSKKAMLDWQPDSWHPLEVGFFKLEVPSDWQILKEPATPDGNQRMVLQDPTDITAVTLMRIPGKGREVDLAKALKGVMGSMLENLEIQKTVINETEGLFFNRVGLLLDTTKKRDVQVLKVHTFGQKLKNDAYLVAMFTFEDTKNKELERIMASLVTPDDPDAEAAKKELAARKAAQKEAKGDHDHSHHGHKH